MWFNDVYFHRRDWILAHYKNLKLDSFEYLVLVQIDLANQQKIAITTKYLADVCLVDENKVDRCLQSLFKKKLLAIKPTKKQVIFDIDGVFTSIDTEKGSSNLLAMFEGEFGRGLSQTELVDLNKLIKRYDEDLILYGLRQASVQGKYSLAYIERIILNETKKNVE